MDKLNVHHEIVVEKLCQVREIGTNPTYAGCQMEDDIGFGFAEKGMDAIPFM